MKPLYSLADAQVDQLAKLSLNRPARLLADPLYDMTKTLTQEFVRIRKSRESDREAILLALCSRTFRENKVSGRITRYLYVCDDSAAKNRER